MSKLVPVFDGIVVDNKMTLAYPERMQKLIQSLSREDGEPVKVSVTLKKYRKPRSGNQNRYYHGVVVALLADKMGYTNDEMHSALQWQFLQTHEDSKLPSVRSTADLSTVEFEDYMTKIRRYASIEEGLYIPVPNEVDNDYGIM